MTTRGRASASFSTFLVRSISSAAAADWRTESTRYPSTPRAGNADKGIYYYKTYDDHSIVGVDMNREELDGSALIAYPLKTDMEFEILN